MSAALDANAKTARWFEYRLPEWQRTAQRLDEVEKDKSAPPAALTDVVRAYPEMARDLAIARRLAPNGALTKRLEQIYVNLHRTIFAPPRRGMDGLRKLFTVDAATVALSLRWHILWVTALFIGSAAAGYMLVGTYPELVSLFASEEMIDTVARGELWTDSILNVFPSPVLSITLFTNNIMVSLFAVCLGVFFGLGTIYIIGMNGFMLGAIFAFTAQYGLAGRLFEFVAAHGFVELSVICVAGASGVSLGEALARPGHRTRAQAFHLATMSCAKLAVVNAAFLVGAGIIEGYVSPNPAYPLWARVAIGLTYFAVFACVLTGMLDPRRRARV